MDSNKSQDKIVRVVRTIEYIGPEKWMDEQLRKSFLQVVGVNAVQWTARISVKLLKEEKSDVTTAAG